ncbi:hypothetical protein JAAARDRAFT_209953 [Jaapia argillacea MUCL 33604]|uniref:DUF6533 domain-containing protein n=1 Tax=Jaapia argillacea MUCL 33604 TaxID=933084 RepID=A0A067PIE9_9AGAM|nr:hypothetical protein JAAARDRAFT_209953 [Jaapia argillacea MUCL 33604]
MSGFPPPLIEAAREFIQDIQSTRFLQISAAGLTIYDHIITIEQEYELIWTKRWSLAKVLFILNRYLGDAVMIAAIVVSLQSDVSQGVSATWFPIQAWLSSAIGWSLQAIMQLRIYALYNRSKPVTMFMAVCFLTQIIAMATVLGTASPGLKTLNEPIPQIKSCVVINVPRYYFSYWIFIIVYDAVLLCLSAYQGLRDYARRRAMGKGTGSSLIGVLLRDSFLYYFVVLVLYIADAITWLRDPSKLEIPEGLTLAMSVILGSRLVLNLRRAYYAPISEELGGADEVSALRAVDFEEVGVTSSNSSGGGDEERQESDHGERGAGGERQQCGDEERRVPREGKGREGGGDNVEGLQIEMRDVRRRSIPHMVIDAYGRRFVGGSGEPMTPGWNGSDVRGCGDRV